VPLDGRKDLSVVYMDEQLEIIGWFFLKLLGSVGISTWFSETRGEEFRKITKWI
jgi:hypothetical protein